MMKQEKLYINTIFIFLTATLLPLVLTNFVLGESIWMNASTSQAAVDWQAETGGVVNIEPRQEHRYKSLMLEQKLNTVNAIVLGSSTAMGISADSLKGHGSVYNFSQSSRTTNGIIAEAKYIAENARQLKYLLIPLDWALGNVYRSDKIPVFSPDDREHKKPLFRIVKTELAKVRDALALPRVIDLFTMLQTYFTKQLRNGGASSALFAPYTCPGGVIARDYTSTKYGICSGFRVDGSNVFTGRKRVDVHRYAALMSKLLSPGSFYYKTMQKYKGQVNKQYLSALLEITKSLDAKGVKVVFLLPPLLPGLEKGLSARSDIGKYVKLTKHTLLAWARQNGLQMIDAGRSEDFGCRFNEFIDGHHTVTSCYNKILKYQPLRYGEAKNLFSKHSAFSIQ